MATATILALLDPERGSATLQLAKLAAAATNGSVDAVIVKGDPLATIPLIADRLNDELFEQLMDSAAAAEDERAAKAKLIYEQFDMGETWALLERVGAPAEVMATEGRVREFCVLPCSDSKDENSATIAGALFGSGRPTLIAPLHKVSSLGDRIAIFWKDGPESAKAVWSALPFLKKASVITAFSVGEEEEVCPALDRLKAGLAGVGVSIQTAALEFGGETASGALLDAAAGMDADLIVMGAFSHSRYRELILGGVTQDALDTLARPILMAH